MKFKEDQTAQKLRGGYYTPEWLATYLVKWAREDGRTRTLEPSCGDGAFIRAIGNVCFGKDAKLTAFELEPHEADKARAVVSQYDMRESGVLNEDFLVWAERSIDAGKFLFESVVGNPPYIRYQFMSREMQDCAGRIASLLGLNFTRHTNAWLPFIASGIALARPGGRLAMVIPAEIMTVSYAAPLREFLVKECSSIKIIDPTDLWFPNTSQGAIALLCQKKRAPDEAFSGISVQSVTGQGFVAKRIEELFSTTPRAVNFKSGDKWTRALLTAPESDALDELAAHSKVYHFNEIASVEVGIVTGANEFFFVDEQTVQNHGLEQYAKTMIGKAEHVSGLVFDQAQIEHNREKGYPTTFLSFKTGPAELPLSVQKYIADGEVQGFHERYKCRIRSPWYHVPSVRPSVLSLSKRCHIGTKLIFNESEVYTTDTFYRVASKIDANTLVSSFINPLTALSAELIGRSYGGGVLELIPSEVSKLLIPVSEESVETFGSLNQSFLSNGYDAFCLKRGERIFRGLGVDSASVDRVISAWLRLRSRRFRVSETDDTDNLELAA
jgi:adenine-specific DNA methylase